MSSSNLSHFLRLSSIEHKIQLNFLTSSACITHQEIEFPMSFINSIWKHAPLWAVYVIIISVQWYFLMFLLLLIGGTTTTIIIITTITTTDYTASIDNLHQLVLFGNEYGNLIIIFF